jgi:UDP-N-acetylmuramoyl-tripeptide--D-alanyl-D-alanine ligase
MAAALKAARRIAKGTRLAAVLGHMAELGPIAFEEHERLGELVVRIGVTGSSRWATRLGDSARRSVRQLPEDVATCDDPMGAADDVRAWANPGDVVLVKGSRVAGLERAADALR